MKQFFLSFLLIPISLFSQDLESWNTVNVSNHINDKTSLVVEAEQRFNVTNNYVRYFHYDIGYLKTIHKNTKLGFYYREVYEVKNDYRIQESRPHLDLFYSDKNWNHRFRLEYQIRENLEDMFRFRYRPVYCFKNFNNFNPYIGNEVLISKYGFTRNRFNVGMTIKLKSVEIQPSYLFESVGEFTIIPIKVSKPWTHRNVIWVNLKIKI